jgi:lipopolysaccharide/colanic/teichoic acid biosynthesis glycosyltransferase
MVIASTTRLQNNFMNAEVLEEEPEKDSLRDYSVSMDELEKFIKETYGNQVFSFLSRHMDFQNPAHLLTDTASRLNILKERINIFETIINLKRVNDIRYVNKFFEIVNSKLPVGGTFAGCVETKNMRKERILNKYPRGINYGMYSLDFILKRIFPKLWFTKKIYFFLTRGNNRVISRAEILGRLVSCGFRIEEQLRIHGYLYFVVKKEKEPQFPQDPTYGPLIKLKRVGKNGKIIKVYKLRTMHPYSEYLQKYVYKQNDLEQNGKFKDDFRISTLGKIFRKLWIDELPMLINLLKGDLKLVGVRPISKHYYNLYSEELQQKRIRYKPGLFPPFYADLPKTLEEIMASELKYLEAYEKSPLLTDVRYFWKVFKNIAFKRARSS